MLVKVQNTSLYLPVGIIALLAMAANFTYAESAHDRRAKLRAYPTKYYVIHTDLDVETVREAAARLSAMAEEYHRRTKGFSGTIRKRLPFYLFNRRQDYFAAGGMEGTVGVFKGSSLMAVVPEGGRTSSLWQIVQHEGFHQFAHRVISANLPVWVNEGLAEYFELGIWTGDNYVTGVIPPRRLQRLKGMIQRDQVRAFREMITMTRHEWNADVQWRNYCQAWSMVHFLVHADGGKYQSAFADFINDIADGRPWRFAFAQRFGRDVKAFQKRYEQWWSSLDDNPTAEKYVLAVVQTLTSYLARALSQRQRFRDAEAFFQAARDGRLKFHPQQWLPPRLLSSALKRAKTLGQWSLIKGRLGLAIVLTRPDGTTFTGTFTLRAKRVEEVEVRISRPGPGSQPALKEQPDE